MALMTAMCFPRKSSIPGVRCAIDLDITTVTNSPRMDATPSERCAIDLDITSYEFSPDGCYPG